MDDAERSLHHLLEESHTANPDDLADLVARHARDLGAHDAVIHLADLQQRVLIPMMPNGTPRLTEFHPPLGVDSTVAGKAFQQLRVLTQEAPRTDERTEHTRVWLPLLDGSERLGVLGVTLSAEDAHRLDDGLHEGGPFATRLTSLATIVAELVMSKTQYGDSIVNLRRTAPMGLAAEIQWSLLPPLTFSNGTVTIAGGLEPAYEVAGDSLDYAVDDGTARFAVFDGMGHGIVSAQLVNLVVAGYRNARRAGLSLHETADHIESAVSTVFRTESFSTGLLCELDTAGGVLRWLSAGHLEPLLLRGGRLIRALQVEPRLPFGLNEGLAGTEAGQVGVEQLEPGDLVLLYTDGITEARSPDGEFFGQERLVDLVVRNLAAGLPPAETMRRVVQALLEHQSGDLDDDATLLLVSWHGGSTDS
ncbi:PP2C family protein-serine/threonine phosphatase [Nocardioides pacificus]